MVKQFLRSAVSGWWWKVPLMCAIGLVVGWSQDGLMNGIEFSIWLGAMTGLNLVSLQFLLHIIEAEESRKLKG